LAASAILTDLAIANANLAEVMLQIPNALLIASPGHKDIDWPNVDPASIKDLMLLFDILKNTDGYLKKYKCRIVFRGDRCKNLEGYNLYASSVVMNSLFLFLGIVARENHDMSHQVLQTSLLYTDFPDSRR